MPKGIEFFINSEEGFLMVGQEEVEEATGHKVTGQGQAAGMSSPLPGTCMHCTHVHKWCICTRTCRIYFDVDPMCSLVSR